MIRSLAEWQQAKGDYQARYICPLRLHYPNDEADMTLVSALADKVSNGVALPDVPVAVKGDNFYVVSSVETALAMSLAEQTWVKCVFTKVDINLDDYVDMEDSLS